MIDRVTSESLYYMDKEIWSYNCEISSPAMFEIPLRSSALSSILKIRLIFFSNEDMFRLCRWSYLKLTNLRVPRTT